MMNRFIRLILILCVYQLLFSQSYAFAQQDKMKWWRDARFGMFIHYGLYSQCEGYWEGKPISGIGEWIFHHAEIPVNEYKKLAKTFKGENLNPEDWVLLAKKAGMKYIVITAKHHDGFALFKSEVNEFNVVDATPYGKDIIKEFVDACRKHNMKIGFYYSQFQDWSYPGAGGNDWEPGFDYSKEGFKAYMDKKALPQVRELLTNYGTIDMIWYDTPGKMSKDESEAFLNLAKDLQPNIIVSGRVGNGVGDYVQMEDNDLPKKRPDFDWEAPVTMNHTWAYKRDDNHWKTVGYMLWQLTYSCSMGGNYLLNIGPKGDGSVPVESIKRLNAIGEWMDLHHEAVSEVQPSPFQNAFDWGGITHKGNKLYLNIAKWPENEIAIFGLNNKVRKSYLLSNKQEVKTHKDGDYLVIDTPDQSPDKHIHVIVLEIEGEPEANQEIVQKLDGDVLLEAELATNTTGKETHFGSMKKWMKPSGALNWNFTVTKPGNYAIQVITTGFKRMAWPEKPALWDGGHQVTIECNNQKISDTVDRDYEENPPYDLYNTFKVAQMGTVRFDNPGVYNLNLSADKIVSKNKAGLAIRMVKLTPVTKN